MTARAIPQPPKRRRPWRQPGPRAAFVAVLGLGLASTVAALLVFAWPSSDVPRTVRLTIPAEDVPAPGGQPLRVADGRFFLVNLRPEEGAHGVRGQLGGGGLIALSWKDPFRGCTVQWRPDFLFSGKRGWFRDPCHGETYTTAGVKVFGPQPRSLDTFALTVGANGDIVVDVARRTLGADDNPTRAVRYPPN